MPMIKCTDEQAYLIELCLDTMSRATAGQLTRIVEAMEQIKGKSFEVKCPDGEVRSFYSLGSYIEEMIKPILFPELSPNASYGVGQKAIGKAQILYEMVKVLQNYRAEKENHSKHSVTWHKPLHYSKKPLIEVMSLQNEMKKVKRHAIAKGKNGKKVASKGRR
ncbi:MAG: hypothetical protein MUF05_07375 [Candidatus Omnitrophica bacterium]|jgi:hypothetical protein|nr:hypothetical protein [Candidatus Omnitrophota bacterium]